MSSQNTSNSRHPASSASALPNRTNTARRSTSPRTSTGSSSTNTNTKTVDHAGTTFISSTSKRGRSTKAGSVHSVPMKRTKRVRRTPAQRIEHENKENIQTEKVYMIKPVQRVLSPSDLTNELTILDLFHVPRPNETFDITDRVNNTSR